MTLDDGVQLLAHIILDIHFVSYNFVCNCLLEFRCLFVDGVSRANEDDYAFLPDAKRNVKKNQKLEKDEEDIKKDSIIKAANHL